MSGPSSSLRLVQTQSGIRYALHERPLKGGDILQLCCSGGWITGRFEWSGDVEVPPSFFFSIELEQGRVAQERLLVPEGALFRFP